MFPEKKGHGEKKWKTNSGFFCLVGHGPKQLIQKTLDKTCVLFYTLQIPIKFLYKLQFSNSNCNLTM